MWCRLFSLWQKIKLKSFKINGNGRILFKKADTSILHVLGYFTLGAKTLGEMSRSLDETIVVLDDRAQLAVENVTFGRGTRMHVFSGAKAMIGDGSYIADNGFISVSTSLSIGKHCAISWNFQLLDNDGHILNGQQKQKPIVIEDHVWIGANVTILKGSKIGEGSVVAAGAVVCGEFPARSLIGGVPARVLRSNVEWR